jgi:protein-tyrosine phosphatase
MLRILVVCTANICRSPAGEVFLAHALAGRNAQVDSAGTMAIDNHYAHPEIEGQMRERGFEQITAHRSTALMPSRLDQYGLILCMEQEHLDWIKRMQPTATGKAKLLGHWSGQKGVTDPINGPKEGYTEALNTIERYSQQWADKVVALGMCT